MYNTLICQYLSSMLSESYHHQLFQLNSNVWYQYDKYTSINNEIQDIVDSIQSWVTITEEEIGDEDDKH